jgi:hypothetical protein
MYRSYAGERGGAAGQIATDDLSATSGARRRASTVVRLVALEERRRAVDRRLRPAADPGDECRTVIGSSRRAPARAGRDGQARREAGRAGVVKAGDS